MKKVFVDVLVKHTKEGEQIPIEITWEDGQIYEIDKVFEHKKAASLKVGGAGIRYLVKIRNKQVYLFFDEDKWFMEGK